MAAGDQGAATKQTDLPTRVMSALVMLAVAAFAVGIGGYVLDAFLYLVALIAFGEFVMLVWRATPNW